MRLLSSLCVVLSLAGMAQGQPGIAADERVWFTADYLLWWTRDERLPVPLVTAGPVDGVGPNLGLPGTSTILGSDALSLGPRSGGRFNLGIWLDEDQTWAVEADFLFLASRARTRMVSGSAGADRLIGVPFLNALDGEESHVTLNLPVLVLPEERIPTGDPGDPFIIFPAETIPGLDGAAQLTVRNLLCGAEANARWGVYTGEAVRVQLLGGFRYLHHRSDLAFTTSSLEFPTREGDLFTTLDEFGTRNDFYGGQLGAAAAWVGEWISLSVTSKVALGAVEQRSRIDGALFTTAFDPDLMPPVRVFPGGIFAQRSNIGSSSTSRFAVVPEGSVQLGVRLTRFLTARVGYTFLYISSIAQPGRQIDRVLNPNQSEALLFITDPPGIGTGPARPVRQIQSDDFWAQGLNFGLELRY